MTTSEFSTRGGRPPQQQEQPSLRPHMRGLAYIQRGGHGIDGHRPAHVATIERRSNAKQKVEHHGPTLFMAHPDFVLDRLSGTQ